MAAVFAVSYRNWRRPNETPGTVAVELTAERAMAAATLYVEANATGLTGSPKVGAEVDEWDGWNEDDWGPVMLASVWGLYSQRGQEIGQLVIRELEMGEG